MTRSPLAIAFDVALLAGDVAVSSLLGDTILDGGPEADPSMARAVVEWAFLAATVAYLVALAVFRDVFAPRTRQEKDELASSWSWLSWLSIPFFSIVVTVMLMIGLENAVESLAGGETDVEGFLAVGGMGVLFLSFWLSFRVATCRPRRREPSLGRRAVCVAMTLPIAVLMLAFVTSEYEEWAEKSSSVDDFWGWCELLFAESTGMAVASFLIAAWPRWLAARAAGQALSGCAFFLALWTVCLVDITAEAIRAWLGG